MNKDNQKIARNTLLLYFRMGLTMLVGLYTGRVILDVLGVDNYGIYGVVGSVISVMAIINGTLSGATSRFITFELGKGDSSQLKKTFSSAFIVHVIIALIVLVLAETVGLWLLDSKLVIPQDRMHAAHMVYQISIVSAMIGITQVPYNAAIIAHERMDAFAYIELLNVTLKLLIVFLLKIGGGDKLILYGWLVFGVSALIAMIYRGYCIKNFPECKLSFVWDKSILKEIGKYSLYSMFCSVAVTGKRQGNVMITNIFFGVAINAAASLASTVSGIIQGFTGNTITAIKPQIVKSYAAGDKDRFISLVTNSVTIMVVIMCVSSFTAVISMDYLLSLWLVEIPAYTSIFCKISLFFIPFSMAETIVTISNTAHGNIKWQSYFCGAFLWFELLLIYLLYKFTHNPTMGALVSGVSSMILFCTTTYLTSRNIPYLPTVKIIISAYKAFFICLVAAIPAFILSLQFNDNLFAFVTEAVICIACTSAAAWFLIFNDATKNLFKQFAGTFKNKLIRQRT